MPPTPDEIMQILQEWEEVQDQYAKYHPVNQMQQINGDRYKMVWS